MTNKHFIVLVIVIVLVGTVIGYLSKGTTVVREIVKNVGAIPGSSVSTEDFAINGVTGIFKTQSFTSATTTPCAIKSPSATSTLISANATFTVSSTSASRVTMARSASPNATTTSLGESVFSANEQGTVIASTTGSHIFAPNTYFVVGMKGGSGTFSPSGKCSAIWQQL
jgi:hypothetical protein